jgi:type I restriction enzyme M protein
METTLPDFVKLCYPVNFYYNLDIKNPHTVDVAHRDFGEMLGDYRSLESQVTDTREQLRRVLMAALEN